MGCCGGNKPKWKREIVPDHKFDNIDLDAFYNSSFKYSMGQFTIYLLTIKSFAVYIADFWTAISLLVIGQTTTTPAIPTEISKWLFFACIMISFLVLIWDMNKSRRILQSRDISYAFTSVIVNRYLSMKDYRIYCLFESINANSKGLDSYAFFVYFQLKGWKHLLLAEAPRRVINVITLAALVPDWLKIRNGTVSFDKYALGDTTVQQILTITMAFSVLMFSISFFLVCIALILYIPLLCHIQGNLKEYCCHKVDKRIAEIIRKQHHQHKKKPRYISPESEKFLEKQINQDKRPSNLPFNSSNTTLTNNSFEMDYSYYKKTPVNKQYFQENGRNVTNQQTYFSRPLAHNTHQQNLSSYSNKSFYSQIISKNNGYMPLTSSRHINEQQYHTQNYSQEY